MLTPKQRKAFEEALARSPKGAGVGATPEAEGRRAALGALPLPVSRKPTDEEDIARRDELRELAKPPPPKHVLEISLPPEGIHQSEELQNDEIVTAYVEDGVVRRVAARPPPYLVPNIPIAREWDMSKSYDGVTDLKKPPHNLNRSALAFWYSLIDLVEHDTCYFWTVTAKTLVPDSWFGNMHALFIREMHNASRRGEIHEWWGGLRVFEPHPGGHGLHSHLVLRNRMPWKVVKSCAEKAGLGRVNVHPQRVELPLVRYLCKYLMKGGKEMAGVRRWRCVGTYEGCKKNDIVFSGTRADRIKQLAAINRVKGMHRFPAYNLAVQQYEQETKDALWGVKGKPAKPENFYKLDNSREI